MPRILVVDDSESVLAYLEQVLQAAGHEVFAAASGTEAVKILKRESLDLVVTDIYMPAPDGLELLLLAPALHLPVPFIAMLHASLGSVLPDGQMERSRRREEVEGGGVRANPPPNVGGYSQSPGGVP
jgi:chemotaxis response regulator CheB